jgi:hypothetical protein
MSGDMLMSRAALARPDDSFVGIKVIMGVNLVSYASRRRAGMEDREAEDAVNDFGRDPIGEGKEEQVGILVASLTCSVLTLLSDI